MSSMDLNELTKIRLASMAAGSKVGTDAIHKSLRGYTTRVHPLFIERLSVYWDQLHKRSTFEGRTFTYDRDCADMTGSNLMNYVFQSFYEQECRDTRVDVIYPKVSRKTSVQESALNEGAMYGEVVEWLASRRGEDGVGVTELSRLASHELGSIVTQDLFGDLLASPLTKGIQSLLYENSFQFPSNQFVTIPARHIDKTLVMKVKYYPSRDDNRAYCADTSRLRSLVAACLNRLIAPKKMATRQKLHSASVLRPDKKDILDLHLPHTPSGEVSTVLIITDTSNFTGSLANAWLMVYTMSLELTHGRLEDRGQLFSIGGEFVHAKWSELLILYLYLTVGVPCWIEDQSQYGYLPGGFLGVGGNITIGLLCLAVVTQSILNRLRGQVLYIHAQAGGDDLAFVVQCATTDVEVVERFIFDEMTSYVGKVKELVNINLDDLDDGIIEGVTYCRKRIVLRRDRYGIHLEGEPSVPLSEYIFPSSYVNQRHLQHKAWREWDYNLRAFEELMPNALILADTLRQLFLEVYRKVKPIRSYHVKYVPGTLKLVNVGRSTLTDTALRLVESIREIRYGSLLALDDFNSKLRHALILEIVSIERVDYGYGDSEEVIIAEAERATLRKLTWTEEIYINYDIELLDELISIVNE